MIKNTLNIKSNNLLLFTLLIVFSCINLYGCKPEQKGEPPARLAETFMEYVKNGEPEKAIALYSDKMFATIPKENWLKSLAFYRDYHGALKSYKLELTKQVQNKQKEYSGIYTYLVYKVQYEKQENQEVFTIRQPTGGGDSELAGHYLNVEVVEPTKLLERIFTEQSGISTAKEDSTKQETPKENSSQQSTTEVDTSIEEKTPE
jgi:hypothetical protein